MPRGPIKLRRLLLAAAAVVIGSGAIAPLLNADRFKSRVRDALGRALQRRVEIGAIRLSLLTGPGFSVKQVTIHEDPSIGLEPFAYVKQLHARVNLLKLWAGPLEFSSLQLIEPSVNLASSEGKTWNIAPLLARAAGASIPRIHVSGGRINFRAGERKSVYYVSNADLSLSPAAQGFDIRFSGEPARTDRGARGFGRFRGTLGWRPAGPPERQLRLDVELEPSAIAEIMMLLQGRDVGLHGLLASTARLEGSPALLRIKGDMQLQDIHRWNLMAEHGEGWRVPYSGVLDMMAGTLDLKTPSIAEAGLQLRVKATDILSRPHGGAHLVLRKIPAGPLLAAARHIGVGLPEVASASGAADGVVSYSSPGGLEGRVQFTDAALTLPDAPPVRLAVADVLLNGGRLQLNPALAEVGENRVTVEGSYEASQDAMELRIATRQLGIEQFREELGKYLGRARVPLLAEASGGSWSGSLSYAKAGKGPGEWKGAVHIRKTSFEVPGVAEPVLIAEAAVAIDGLKLQVTGIEGEVAHVPFAGEYRHEPSFARPHRFKLRVLEISANDLERLFAPSLQRRQGFLARTLRLGSASAPEWLRRRKASGTIEAGTIDIAGAQIGPLRARVLWDATAVELTSIEGRWNDSPLSMSGAIELASQGPRYRVEGQVRNVPWNGGRIDLDGLIRASGTGIGLLNGMRAEGNFSARSISLQNENFRSMSGSYDLQVENGAARLKLHDVQATSGLENFVGDGGTQPDGRIRMELAGTRTLLRLTGTMWPLELESSVVR